MSTSTKQMGLFQPPVKSGILLVDKPVGMSSADITNKLKKTFKISKIGHGGTLDPFASGLLVVLIGEATKIARFLLDGEKGYEAILKIGTSTNTGDPTGTAVETGPELNLSLDEWKNSLDSFLGVQKQLPPQFSALKVGGKPLYTYAREGKHIEVEARNITVRKIQALTCEIGCLTFRVLSSGGTYVRVLGEDIAKKAGSVGHLQSLRRTQSSEFSINDAKPLADLLQFAASNLPILPLQLALSHLPIVTCSQVQADKIRKGNIGVFDELKKKIQAPGYFLLLEEPQKIPVAVANFHPMITPQCSIERVFDPLQVGN